MPNLRQLDLNLLKAQDALLGERKVARAAARLNLTQPAVSGMLTRLRESVDDALPVPDILRASDLVAAPRRLVIPEFSHRTILRLPLVRTTA